ncbi:AraC family transcriptional regulator [Paenibacillus abyssi]|uniref:AraC family transcriptional regulator n=1 Tax=Paenibacillus abyssi TaxID=1340531 RepID=A0A917D428_9BACL|nr:AraC family transcriptional regulator [Paenibacillus abyssi]GGG06635.1 AraC family transcriptional regulator [Paenibacillus abyssi]
MWKTPSMLPTASDRKGMIDYTFRSTSPIDPVLHSHSYYEVYYFHEGKCNYLIGDKIFVLEPGDLIIMYGMTLHCAKIDKSVEYVRSIVHFEPDILRPFLEPPFTINVLQPFQELKNHRIQLRGKDKEEAERILFFMHEQQQRQDRIGDNRMRLAFADLLYFVYERCLQPLQSRPELPSEKERTVQGIISFLEQNYAEDLNLEHLQGHMHLSRSYLAKIFKEVTGVTIFDFVYRWRINQARILFLIQPQLSVTDVGFQVGFKHLAHFSRLFKQHIGVTPEQYRKQVRQSETAESE